jgi:hypothetical protein
MDTALMLAAGMLSGVLATQGWQKLAAWWAARSEEWEPY